MSDDFIKIIDELELKVSEEKIGNASILITLQSNDQGPASIVFHRDGFDGIYDYSAEFQIRRKEPSSGNYAVVNHVKWRMKAEMRIQHVDYEMPSSFINGIDLLTVPVASYSLWAKKTSGPIQIQINNTIIKATIIG